MDNAEITLRQAVLDRLEALDTNAFSVERAAGLPADAIRSILRGQKKSGTTLNNAQRVCEALGLELYIGPRRMSAPEAPKGKPTRFDVVAFSDGRLPRRGFAKCGIDGWGEDGPTEETLPKPEGFDDPDAFYVTALGQSMIPEGIWPGAFCLVSPDRKPKPGDRVWIRDTNRKVAIKRLVEFTERGVKLRGWQNVEGGSQRSYDEERFMAGIDAMHPVVAVYDRAPSSGKAEFVADPIVDSLPIGGSPGAISGFSKNGFGIVKRHSSQLHAPNPSELAAIAFPLDWLNYHGIDPERSCLVQPDDDGMAPTIRTHSTLVVNQAVLTPGRGHVFAIREDKQILFRRLEEVSGQLIVSADNPVFPTRILTNDDRSNVAVLGRVVCEVSSSYPRKAKV